MAFGLYGSNQLFQNAQQVIEQVLFRRGEYGSCDFAELKTFFCHVHDIVRVNVIRDLGNIFRTGTFY